MLNLERHFNLKNYNTFGISAYASSFIEINSEQELSAIFQSIDTTNQKILILGSGSNMLFTKDFDGLVIKINIKGINVQENGKNIIVTAGAGEIWHHFVMYCVENGYAGIENLSLIPGTVGASPVQNIGAYGVEIKDVFLECRAFEIATGNFKTFNNSEAKFSYRESIFKSELKGKFIITSVSYKLSKSAQLHTHYGAIQAELDHRNIKNPSIKNISDVVSSIRVSKLPDPSTIGNAGSFFKNPIIDKEIFDELAQKHKDLPHYAAPNNKIKLAAGWLIEQCGFKGVKDGNTGTWKNQALVLVNHGSATGKEIFEFSEKIIQTVHHKFGITLEREVNII